MANENPSRWADGATVGMIHLQPLPGSHRWAGGSLCDTIGAAVLDARALAQGGVNAIIIENFFDAPFTKAQVGPETVAAMTACVVAVREALDAGESDRRVRLGVNVLRNDARSALGIAKATGAEFVRVNVLSGAAVTDQGLIEGQAYDILRYRKLIDAERVEIWADVRVKHAAPLVDRPLSHEVAELVERAGADAVIVSGEGTGEPTDPVTVEQVRAAAKGRPVLVGSGVSEDNASGYPGVGIIVGTSIKKGGRIDQPVDVDRVCRLIKARGQQR